MIYAQSWPFPYTVLDVAPCCGEIRRVRASLIDLIKAAKVYAAEHDLHDTGSVVEGIAPL
jgi:hypothetical protein